MKKKIAVFTGAGVSAESGITTFRGIKNGLWYNYKVEDVNEIVNNLLTIATGGPETNV